jgi:iron complex transport system permease protein
MRSFFRIPSGWLRSPHSIRLFGDRVSFRIDRETLLAAGLLLTISAVIAAGSLMSGKYPVALYDVLRALAGLVTTWCG